MPVISFMLQFKAAFIYQYGFKKNYGMGKECLTFGGE